MESTVEESLCWKATISKKANTTDLERDLQRTRLRRWTNDRRRRTWAPSAGRSGCFFFFYDRLRTFDLRFLLWMYLASILLERFRSALQKATSREMLVISRQNGLRLLSSRLSGYRQKFDGHVLIGCCDDLRTDRLRVKLKELRGRVPVGRFFLLILLALASCGRFASADHLTVYFLVCRSLRVWMAGMLANFMIFLSYYY